MAVFFIALMMEAERTSETLVNFYQTARRYNPEESHFLQGATTQKTAIFIKMLFPHQRLTTCSVSL
jgi:hypothetical protein